MVSSKVVTYDWPQVYRGVCIPACLAAGLWEGGVCIQQVSSGEGCLGPHPRGKLRGIRSRPTPKGEIEGDQIQAHTQRGNWGESDPGPHPRGKLRGIRSRPTPKGEIEGDQIQAAGTHPTAFLFFIFLKFLEDKSGRILASPVWNSWIRHWSAKNSEKLHEIFKSCVLRSASFKPPPLDPSLRGQRLTWWVIYFSSIQTRCILLLRIVVLQGAPQSCAWELACCSSQMFRTTE